MLTPAIIEAIVDVSLPHETIVRHLQELQGNRVDAATLRLFVEVLRSRLDAPARALRQYAGALDPSGTGGSGLPHFNTSTTVAFVLAAGGVKVAKFGNRAAQSTSGSFDLLDVVGVPSFVPPQAVPELLEELKLAFLFAPQYYPGLARLAPLRQSIGKRTIFNILGPLLNPIQPDYRVMGVSCELAQQAIAEYLAGESSNRRALLVRAHSGLDELEPYGENLVIDATPGTVREISLGNMPPAGEQESRSFAAARSAQMRQSAAGFSFTPQENYNLFIDIINGRGPQWITDTVCLNAAAGFVASGYLNFAAGFERARELIGSKAVAGKFEQCRRAYGQFAS